MSRFKRPPAKRWTAEALAAHARFYGDASAAVSTHASTPLPRFAHAAAEALHPLLGLCRSARLEIPEPEFTFHPHRKWRFDYAWPAHKVAVEIEGGVWTQGRHTRGAGFIEDMEKYNAAVLLGWRVLRFVPDELHHALPALAQLLGDPEGLFR